MLLSLELRSCIASEILACYPKRKGFYLPISIFQGASCWFLGRVVVLGFLRFGVTDVLGIDFSHHSRFRRCILFERQRMRFGRGEVGIMTFYQAFLRLNIPTCPTLFAVAIPTHNYSFMYIAQK